ncbi:Lipoprotein releasing system transmembrane protein LolC/LolE, partial [hydrothermal vent metagenome]
MNFEWFVCRRYLQAKRRQGFISLISFISVAGVAIGVMALIIVLAVMTGFTNELRSKILGINAHIIVQKYGGQIDNYQKTAAEIRRIPGVKATTPYIFTQVMITSDRGGTGAILRGIDPNSAAQALRLGKYIKGCKLQDLTGPAGGQPGRRLPGIILGSDLARQLRVYHNDKVRLMSNSGPLTPIGILPRIKTCRVLGIFKSGMYEYDSAMAFVSLATAQNFLKLGKKVNGIEVRLNDIYQARNISLEIQKRLGLNYISRDWMQMNKNLFSALELEKTALAIIVALVVIVAAFNIVSTLIMVVMEKSKDIAILKAMGATAAQIRKVFIYEGLVIGLTGTICGLIGGITACRLLARYHFIKLPDVYPISTLPVELNSGDIIMISVGAIIITLLATLYPSWQAARID